MKTPYTEQLAREFRAVRQEIVALATGQDVEEEVIAEHAEEALAEYVFEQLLAPKNARIHDLTSELTKLQAQIHKLEKVLAVHNAGVCRDGEPAIDCAIRMLSPVSDDVPKRDRP